MGQTNSNKSRDLAMRRFEADNNKIVGNKKKYLEAKRKMMKALKGGS